MSDKNKPEMIEISKEEFEKLKSDKLGLAKQSAEYEEKHRLLLKELDVAGKLVQHYEQQISQMQRAILIEQIQKEGIDD
ncbi:hypothetical protein [Endozoicomonas sp. ALB115]|uniref:hypothetical protein n=1 Tax=Endozoicomonas sp. ALB115 TaxID=3403074 RepID=UPI003BB76813